MLDWVLSSPDVFGTILELKNPKLQRLGVWILAENIFP